MSTNPDVENGKMGKKYPFEEKNKWNRRKAIAMTLCQFVALISTIITFRYYYLYYTKKGFLTIGFTIFMILCACEIIPRLIEICVVYEYTKKLTGYRSFGFINIIGIFVGGSDFYYWLGKHRETLEKKQVDRIGYFVDALQLIKLILLVPIFNLELFEYRKSNEDIVFNLLLSVLAQAILVVISLFSLITRKNVWGC
ncbi:9566_t:CDS:2 [Funneliformis mosseae]|uniref:9566_t:CDS:1 n=1 Tax=Funneliformis mosseae TaxID=27381 RepID=A0A9N9G8X6_FUNMO|nr:9566_t:CDS:2 [Funneliformis mosseae]